MGLLAHQKGIERCSLSYSAAIRLFLTIISLERSMWEGPKTNYVTLGPKFYLFSVLSPRICFCFVNPSFLAGIAAFIEILLLALSKHDLKRSWKSQIFGLNSLVGSCRGRFPTNISFDICSRQVLSMRSIFSCYQSLNS